MSNGRESPSTPHGEGQPYKIDTTPVPLDVFSVYGPEDVGCWYRIPSWRVRFDCEALKGVDVRMHRAVGSHAAWTLTEASTGFKMFGDMPHDQYIGDEGSMLAEFCAGFMLKLTPEKVAAGIAKAKEILKTRTPSPFAVSEKRLNLSDLREKISDAAYEWGQYVQEDNAPRTLVAHMEAAFDEATKEQK